MTLENPLPAASSSGTTIRRVFVVDDHPLMRRSLVEAIDREPDLEVCGQADDVPEALPAILALRPDLVLTDIQLKTSSGIDLIKALREQSPQTTIVATTMFDVRRNERLARAAGAAGFASKHAGPEQLVKTVRQVLTKA
jgi:DNA-binding NarL/FixJ family response regulator